MIQLKSAIGTLADAVSEEIETLKKTMILDLENRVNHAHVRMDEVSQLMHK